MTRLAGCALALVPLALASVLGCSRIEDDRPPENSVSPRYMSISGGGWRAHTAQAAWTMGLLDVCRQSDPTNPNCTLEHLLGNVDAISSNSGGTWFSTMLAYSNAFSSSIEADDAISVYPSSNGYLGQSRRLITTTLEAAVEGEELDICSLVGFWSSAWFYCQLSRIPEVDPLIWTTVVDHVVNAPLGIHRDLEGLRLDSRRQRWAEGKSLIFAATLVTDRGILNQVGEFDPSYPFYQAAADDSEVPAQPSVTPVSFSSVSTGRAALDFLSAGDFTASYSVEFEINRSPPPISEPLPAAIDANVRVSAASAASSAALGAGASETVVRINFLRFSPSYRLAAIVRDLAPAFRLSLPTEPIEPAIRQTQPDSTDYKELAARRFFRLADGGYLDNSAVSHMVAYLQRNQLAEDGFQIVAFDNVQTVHTPESGSKIPVGIDFALLFGVSPGPDGVCDNGICVPVAAQNVFENTLASGRRIWHYQDPKDANNELIYTVYRFTTVENRTLGVAAGSKGFLHAFTCKYPKAQTAPTDGGADFDAYDRMLDFIYDGLVSQGGAEHLRAALGASFETG